MKKIAIVGTVGLPACYGGFETLVENLTKYKSKNFKYMVFCSSKNYENKIKEHNEASLFYLPINANGIQSIVYDVISLIYCIFKKPDVILVLGVSGCVFLPVVKFLSKAKIITNIDGLEWKRDKWNKVAQWFLQLSEKIAVKYSDYIICDNEAISSYVNGKYNKESITIAYGGDHAISGCEIYNDHKDDSYCLSICRIEPENNIHLILNAFSNSKRRIKFIGNWSASEYGLKLKKQFSTFANIELIDPIYDVSSLFNIRKNCVLYVHGHSAGGTNPSLVEMMHFNVPIIAYDCTFNRFSTENMAHYFSDENDILSLLELNKKDLTENAGKMKEIALRKYTWDLIVKEYESLY